MFPEALLPGSAYQQKLLQTVIALYAGRSSVLAVLLYGSLGRGKGDAYSDLDLAVVMGDEVEINVAGEVEQVCAALTKQGEQVLFTEVAGEDSFFVLQSLQAIAICYHPLQAMSPYVLEGWQLLCG